MKNASKEYLKKNAKGKLNKQLLLLDFPMLDQSNVKALDTSIARAPFPDQKKIPVKMLLNMPKMMPAMLSMFQSRKLIKKFHVKDRSQSIDAQTFERMIRQLKECGIDNIGYVKIDEADVFKHLAVPYQHVIIFTARQEKSPILTSPSIQSQVEVSRIYGVTGRAANKVSLFLDQHGFGAMPSHSLGGAIDYTKLAYRAGLGCFGRHGLLIEPTSGPNHRIGAIFTNIDNLGDYFNPTNEHLWIKDFCKTCGKCITKCPAKAIKETPAVNENGYTTCIEYEKCGVEFGSNYGCNVCVAVCPFTTAGYEKIKNSFLRKNIHSTLAKEES